MKKVFLFLYPIKEYTRMFLFRDYSLYQQLNIKNPLDVLNKCIEKRYRSKGYQVIFVTYPDRPVFVIETNDNDRVIYTDVTFDEASGIDNDGNIKTDFSPKYPSEKHILQQIGVVDELVIGGYHCHDCVKRVGNMALELGVKTLIDIDMTEFFFHLYKDKDYFQLDNYDPLRYKKRMLDEFVECNDSIGAKKFTEAYSNPIFGFDIEKGNILKDSVKNFYEKDKKNEKMGPN